MANLNSIKKIIAQENLKVSVSDPLNLLAECFNGVIFQIDK